MNTEAKEKYIFGDFEKLGYFDSFIFKEGTINSNIIKILKSKDIAYNYNNFGVLYADIFGCGQFAKIEVVYICSGKNSNDSKFEIYYNLRYCEKVPIYKSKPFTSNEYKNTYYIKAFFADGDSIQTRINGSAKTIYNYYIGANFQIDGTIKKCINIDFIECEA